MKLIGMLDSPYVRRTAIAMRLLDIPFEHRPWSVFGDFDRIRDVNAAVKVPTLVCDDGTVLMDSGLIIEHLESVAGRSLWPASGSERLRAIRITGLALAACEKAVQIVYERHLRPVDKQFEGWTTRIVRQVAGALSSLEAELAQHPLVADESGLGQAGITAAVAWRFVQSRIGDVVAVSDCPALAEYADRLERLPVFVAIPSDETANASTAG